MKGVAAAARPAARTRVSRCSEPQGSSRLTQSLSFHLHTNHSVLLFLFAMMVGSQVSSVRESDNHSFSLHCVPARILLSSIHSASRRSLAWGSPSLPHLGTLGSPGPSLASLHPYAPRRAQTVKRGPRKVNVRLALKLPGPQKSEKRLPGSKRLLKYAHAL